MQQNYGVFKKRQSAIFATNCEDGDAVLNAMMLKNLKKGEIVPTKRPRMSCVSAEAFCDISGISELVDAECLY